MFELGDR